MQGPPRHSVPLAAAFKDMTHVVAAPADQAGVSRPDSRSHPSYVALRDFLLALQTVRVGVAAAAALSRLPQHSNLTALSLTSARACVVLPCLPASIGHRGCLRAVTTPSQH
jgi:hypothetical protein